MKSQKMKGLLKGFRYFAQRFEEKELEFQIGSPTDVKHVAHIGWEDPSASKPSWMNEFKSSQEISNGVPNSIEELLDTNQCEKPKHRRRRKSNGADSPRSNDGSKHSRRQSNDAESPKNSRRNRSSNNPMDSPSRNTKHHHQNSNLGAESPAHDHSSVPRHPKGRKTKDSKFRESKSSAGSNNCGAETVQRTQELTPAI
ncbi:CRIB domain-containing protein RIC1 [Jatropha curcas]|uniref:CRIB domain-containing protein RIC1 n=1 Tax=Jatropha curcas TaxID=180498 RepID=UPI0005FB018B|nr:CRIB domain-containing protein RIC1 [Jatropha curcas]